MIVIALAGLTIVFWNFIPGELIAITVIIAAGYGIFLFKRSAVVKNGISRLKKIGATWVGIRFNFITWEITRAVLSILAGAAVAFGLHLFFEVLDVLLPFSVWNPIIWPFAVAIMAVMAYYAWQPDKDENGETITPLIVPEAKMAAYMMPFGLSVGILFMTSEYDWYKKLRLRRSVKRVESFTDEDGFIEMGEVQFPVWDNREATPGSPERKRITAPAKNNSEVTGQLMLIMEAINPRLMLNSADAAMDIGERARQEFRKLTESVVDTDLPKLQSSLADLMRGRKMVTFFIRKNAPGHKEGAMIRNESGEVMFEWVDENESPDEAAERLTLGAFRTADRKMLSRVAVQYDEGGGQNGKTVVSMQYGLISVERPIDTLVEHIGYRLKRVTFADIEFAEKVKAAAEAASAELDERAGHLASTATINEVTKALTADDELAKKPGYQQAQLIAAAQDDKTGSIKILYMPNDGNESANRKALTGAFVGANEVGDES